jgi:tRNA(fMet)-specific endonuclease VapC
MALFVLDTDHVTLLQRGHRRVVERFHETPPETVTTSVVTYEEQLRGRLALIRGAKTPAQLVVCYRRLREMQEFFCVIRVLDFDEKAAQIYAALRPVHRRIGTMDLRIAATALSERGTLVTRNTRDFGGIADLPLADWSLE